MVSLVHRRYLPGSLSHLTRSLAAAFPSSQRQHLKEVTSWQRPSLCRSHFALVSRNPLCSAGSPYWCISVIASLLYSPSITGIKTRGQPRGQRLFRLFSLWLVRNSVLSVKAYFSQVLQRQVDFDLDQLWHYFNKSRTCFRFLDTSSHE